MATISRLLKIRGLFCRLSSLLKGSFAKESYNFKEPTNRSHPVWPRLCMYEVVSALATYVWALDIDVCVFDTYVCVNLNAHMG